MAGNRAETRLGTEPSGQRPPVRTKPLSILERVRFGMQMNRLGGRREYGEHYMLNDERERDAKELAKYGYPVFEPVSELLSHPNHDTQRIALSTCVQIDTDLTCTRLLKDLEERKRIPIHSLDILARSKPTEALPVLNDYLDRVKESPYLQYADDCAHVLGLIRDGSSRDPLIANFQIRRSSKAWISLATIDQEAANEELARIIDSDDLAWHTLYYFYEGLGGFAYPALEFLASLYHERKDQLPYRKQMEYLFAIGKLSRASRLADLPTEQKLRLAAGDRRVLSVFFRNRSIPVQDLPVPESERQKEAVFLSADFAGARRLGISPVESVLEFHRIHPSSPSNFMNDEFDNAIRVEVERIQESDLVDNPREALQELLDFAISRNNTKLIRQLMNERLPLWETPPEELLPIAIKGTVPELTFRLIDAGLPLWETLEEIAMRGHQESSFPPYQHLGYYSHLAYLSRSRGDRLQDLSEEQKQQVDQMLYEYELVNRLATNILSLNKDDWDYIYHHPNALFLRSLARPLGTEVDVGGSNGSQYDPEFGMVSFYSPRMEDDPSSAEAEYRMKDIPWITADVVDKFIGHQPRAFDNANQRTYLQRILRYKREQEKAKTK